MNYLSPIGARRVKTDLKTSENIFIHMNSPNRSSSSLPSSRKNNNDGRSNRSQLPARATRLLNRSRLNQGQISNPGSDSPRSFDSYNNRKASSRPSSQYGHDAVNYSPDEHLFMLDKTLRNSMIQDVQYCKQQLLQLRSILQDDEECLTRTDSLNPFEMNNGKFFSSGGGYDHLLASLEYKERDNYSPSLSDDPKHDLVDLRRQVVYLQSQLDDKDRTIRIQQNLINKLEAEVDKAQIGQEILPADQTIETVNTATQTERLRPLSIHDGSMSKSEDDDTASIHSVITNASSSDSSSNNMTNMIDLTSAPVGKPLTCIKTTHISNGNTHCLNISKSPTKIPQSSPEKSTTSSPSLRRIPRPLKSTTEPLDDKKFADIASVEKSLIGKGNCRLVSARDGTVTTNKGSTNGKYISNILELGNGGVGDQQKTDDGNLNGLIRSPVESVKLLNNLNVLKSKGFAMPVNSNDDF